MRNFILSLAAACAVVIVVAYFLGWINFFTERRDGSFTTGVEIYTGKVSRAADTLEEKARHLGKSAREEAEGVAGTVTAKGTVNRIEGDHHQFTMKSSEGKDLLIQLEPATNIAGAYVKGLREGDHVTVTYKRQGDKNIAQTVTVTADASGS